MEHFHLIWVNAPIVLMEQLLHGNVPLRHLLNEDTLFMSWWRSAIKEVNDKALKLQFYNFSYFYATIHFYRCGKSFCSAQKLKNHVLNIHEGIKDYKCDICGYLTWESCRLKTHISVVHEGKKNYQCDRCEKSFGYVTHLKNHISVVHEGIKKFACSLCSLKFSSNFNLKQHVKNNHKNKNSLAWINVTFFIVLTNYLPM